MKEVPLASTSAVTTEPVKVNPVPAMSSLALYGVPSLPKLPAPTWIRSLLPLMKSAPPLGSTGPWYIVAFEASMAPEPPPAVMVSVPVALTEVDSEKAFCVIVPVRPELEFVSAPVSTTVPLLLVVFVLSVQVLPLNE